MVADQLLAPGAAAARVLGGDQSPLPGLFAAGECAGGVIGNVYIGGGNSVANCLAYGRIAGRYAVPLAAAALPSGSREASPGRLWSTPPDQSRDLVSTGHR